MLGILRSFWFRLAVTIAILVLAFIVSHLDLGQVLREIVDVRPGYLVLTLILVAVDRLVMMARWVLLLRAVGVDLPVAEAGRIFLVSSFVGSFLPAGVGADASRAYSVATRTSQTHEAMASIAVDRLLGMLGIAVLGVLGLAGWSGSGQLRAVAWAVAAVVLAGSAAMFWIDRILRAITPSVWQRKRWGRAALRLGEAIGTYRHHHGTLLLVLLLSVGVQAVRVMQAYSLGRGTGVGVGLGYYFVFMPIGMLLVLLPISVSGFGVPQVSISWMLQAQGVSEPEAFALSTLILATGIVGNVPGAWLYLRPRANRAARAPADNGPAGPPGRR